MAQRFGRPRPIAGASRYSAPAARLRAPSDRWEARW
jgi:hypothetical protein